MKPETDTRPISQLSVLPSSEALEVGEAELLKNCEHVIQEQMAGAMAFAEALATIRDQRLYRAEFDTFEDYCRARWQLTARSVRRLIAQSQVLRNLTVADVDHGTTWTVPASPSVVRPMIGLSPDQQSEVWREAIRTSPQGRPTVKHVEKVVAEFKTRLGLTPVVMPAPAGAGEAREVAMVLEPLPPGLREKAAGLIGDVRSLVNEVGNADPMATASLLAALHWLEAFKVQQGQPTEVLAA